MQGHRANGAGPGFGTRTCRIAASAPAGVLTSAQKTTLASMAEEEKLAHDLYAAFAARYSAPVFDRIAAAESRHLDAVRTVLASYGLADPTDGQAAGAFTSAATKATHDRLLAQGKVSQDAALQAGQAVEPAHIAELNKALNGMTAAKCAAGLHQPAPRFPDASHRVRELAWPVTGWRRAAMG